MGINLGVFIALCTVRQDHRAIELGKNFSGIGGQWSSNLITK